MSNAANDTDQQLSIRPAAGKWVAYVAGAVYAETTAALEVAEGGAQPQIFFPRSDVAMAFFDKAGTGSPSPLKGEATHFSLETKSKVIENAALSYEAPAAGAEALRDYLTFDPDRVTVEQH